MKKKLNNIFTIIVIMFIVFNMININSCIAFTQVYADVEIASTSTINPDNYKPSDPTKEDAVDVLPKIGVILGAIRNISVVVSVIVLMIIGVKYIIGSVEEKANYKNSMLPYIIGCIMAVAGTTLVSFIYNSVH